MKKQKRFLVVFGLLVLLLLTPLCVVVEAATSNSSPESVFMENVEVGNILTEEEGEVLEIFYRELPNGVWQYRIWSVTYGVWRTEWTDLL